MKQFTSKSQKIGESGENIACRYLKSNGYSIIERNYTKKYGEIDVIANKGKMVHFIEIKSVSCEITVSNVIHETNLRFGIRPEENLHQAKLRRLHNTIETYLAEKMVSETTQWQLDLVCVYLDIKNKKAKVTQIENIIM